MPVILASQETEIRRIEVQSQPRQIVWDTLSQKKKKNPSHKRTDGVAQGVGPEFKPLYHKKKFYSPSLMGAETELQEVMDDVQCYI
jgi:hypothetical protein